MSWWSWFYVLYDSIFLFWQIAPLGNLFCSRGNLLVWICSAKIVIIYVFMSPQTGSKIPVLIFSIVKERENLGFET